MDDFQATGNYIATNINILEAVPIKQETTSAHTFTLFSEFPFEIRSKIFSYALHETRSRVVEATFSTPQRQIANPSSPTSTPALLHTNSESRYLALKTYSSLIINDVPTAALIDFENDTLFFTSSFGTNFCVRFLQPSSLFASCRRLAVTDILYWSLFYSGDMIPPMIARFAHLKELCVVYLRNECSDVMNKDMTISYGTGDIVQRDGVMSFGEEGIELAPACENDKRCALIGRHLSYTVFHSSNIETGRVLVISKGYHKIDNEIKTPLVTGGQYCYVCARYPMPDDRNTRLKCDEHSYTPLLLPNDMHSRPELGELDALDQQDSALIAEMVMMGEEYALTYHEEIANF